MLDKMIETVRANPGRKYIRDTQKLKANKKTPENICEEQKELC